MRKIRSNVCENRRIWVMRGEKWKKFMKYCHENWSERRKMSEARAKIEKTLTRKLKMIGPKESEVKREHKTIQLYEFFVALLSALHLLGPVIFGFRGNVYSIFALDSFIFRLEIQFLWQYFINLFHFFRSSAQILLFLRTLLLIFRV